MATAAASHLLATTSALHQIRHATSASHGRHSSLPSRSLATRQRLALGVAHIIIHAQRSDEDQSLPSMTSADEESAAAASSPSSQTLLEALDYSEARSQDDVRLLEDARDATRIGERMSREQYAALRRKIGGTYRDFFKDSVEAEGDFVDEGWVDKSCRFCKKDTASEPRTVDKYGRYAHVACLEKSYKSGNFFSRLLGM